MPFIMEKEQKGCGMCGQCGMYMGHHGILRIVLGLLILGFVFWAGFKLGEFKALIVSGDSYGFGSRMMSGYGSRSMMDWGGYGVPRGMMWYREQAPVQDTTTTTGK